MCYNIWEAYMARNWWQALANGQVEIKAIGPSVLGELNSANDHMYLEAIPFQLSIQMGVYPRLTSWLLPS